MNYLDLSKIPTQQLKAIKSVLEHGSLACGTFFPDKKTLKKLQAENEQLKTLNERRKMLEDAGVDGVFNFETDKDFILNHTDSDWQIFLKHLTEQKTEAALAQATKSVLKVPALYGQVDLNPVEIIREHLKLRKNGGKENG